MEDNKPEKMVSSSTSVQGYTYDVDSQELIVWYRSGSCYKFEKVSPPLVSQIFDSPGSIGSKSYKLLKGYKATEQ